MEVKLHTFLASALDGGEWSASHISHFPHGNNPWYPLYRRLGGPQSQSGCSGEKKNPSPSWESNPGHPAHSLITILAELPQLQLIGSKQIKKKN